MFYIEIHEGQHRIIKGKETGYQTLEEAKKEAIYYVDDALPNNTVVVLEPVGHAYCGGDGEAYYIAEKNGLKNSAGGKLVEIPIYAQQMTIRDSFAIQYLSGIAGSDSVSVYTGAELAKLVYEIADAMLEERKN